MKHQQVVTHHPEIGYTNNVEIIERAIREKFGIVDNSHVSKAVAAHIWSGICGQYGDDKHWGHQELVLAITQCQMRLRDMLNQLTCTRENCAVSYAHFKHS